MKNLAPNGGLEPPSHIITRVVHHAFMIMVAYLPPTPSRGGILSLN